MWGLEYPLLFGLPNNKLELIDGLTRCVFPFLTAEQAEVHLEDWAQTLARWKGLPVTRAGRKVEAAGFTLERFPRPIELNIPFDGETFHTLWYITWRRDLWDGQPAGCESGWEWSQRHWDVKLNLWTLFGSLCERYGGLHSGGVDVSLTDTSAVAPDQYYFCGTPEECMIEGDYFQGVPELIAEVLSPGGRAIDRGPRRALYRRAGVPHLWLLDPEPETVEVFELADGDYRLRAVHHAGERFNPALFPDTAVVVDALFDTQWKRHPERFSSEAKEPLPEWLIPPDRRLGLEHLLVFGHPERRHEIWNNRAPCVLPLGSSKEAAVRFGHFLEEVCRWEQAPVPVPSGVGPDAEQAEVGRFRLTRRGRHVWLDVAVDGRKYRDLLRVWANRQAWDWGEG